MRTLQVNGYAVLSIPPDSIELKITLETVSKEYPSAVKTNAKSLSTLKNSLFGANIREEELKTSGYTVNTRYENQRQPNGEYKNVFTGYCVITSLKLDIAYNMEKLNAVINAITTSGAECEYNIRFYVSNQQEVKNKLIALAVEDAKTKAGLLAQAAGVELIGIESITYDKNIADAYSQTDYRPRMMAAANDSISVEPESVVIKDKVNIIWEIQ